MLSYNRSSLINAMILIMRKSLKKWLYRVIKLAIVKIARMLLHIDGLVATSEAG
jgi:hypothetical protein